MLVLPTPAVPPIERATGSLGDSTSRRIRDARISQGTSPEMEGAERGGMTPIDRVATGWSRAADAMPIARRDDVAVGDASPRAVWITSVTEMKPMSIVGEQPVLPVPSEVAAGRIPTVRARSVAGPDDAELQHARTASGTERRPTSTVEASRVSHVSRANVVAEMPIAAPRAVERADVAHRVVRTMLKMERRPTSTAEDPTVSDVHREDVAKTERTVSPERAEMNAVCRDEPPSSRARHGLHAMRTRHGGGSNPVARTPFHPTESPR